MASAAAVEPRPKAKSRWNPVRLMKSLDEKVGNFAIEFSAVKSGDGVGSEKKTDALRKATIEKQRAGKPAATAFVPPR